MYRSISNVDLRVKQVSLFVCFICFSLNKTLYWRTEASKRRDDSYLCKPSGSQALYTVFKNNPTLYSVFRIVVFLLLFFNKCYRVLLEPVTLWLKKDHGGLFLMNRAS